MSWVGHRAIAAKNRIGLKRQQLIALRLMLLGLFGRALAVVTAGVMTIVGLFAAIDPAVRGLRSHPTEALRAE